MREVWLGFYGGQLKFWSDISVVVGFPLRNVGSKAQARLLRLEHQKQERNPNNIRLWKAARFLSVRERWLETQRVSSRANAQNFICSHLPWAPTEEVQSGLETCEENLVLVALGRELKGQPPGSLCAIIPHTAETIFLRQSTPFQVASAWGEAIALPARIPLTPPCAS